MGYNLTIGEAILYTDDICGYIGIDAKAENHDKAPSFDSYDDHINCKSPAYTVWSRFTELAGIEEFNDRMFENGHPGAVLIIKDDVDLLNTCYTNFKMNNPGLIPGYEVDEKKACLARLEWLHYWVNWAFNNCEKPVFING